jgi:thioredoxin reductase (NADPH)
MTEIRDTVILGSGCAGLTAAIYTARAGLKPLVLEGHEPGGQLSITTLVENFPGWPEGIQGPELIDNMKKQAGAIWSDLPTGASVARDSGTHPIRLFTSAGEIDTRTLIVASGASARWLGTAERAGADWAWRFKLRNVRRVFLPRQGDCGGGRR